MRISHLPFVLISTVLAPLVCAGTVDEHPSTRFSPFAEDVIRDRDHVDLDAYLFGEPSGPLTTESSSFDPWSWQFLPPGLIYENYLAGTKESRLGAQFITAKHDGWLIDTTVGGRVGLIRYGTNHPVRPEGWQLDIEGSGQLRLDPSDHMDFRSVDFRGGLPVSYGTRRSRWKFGYYHLSSHLGDEFLQKNPGFQRLNFSRDVLILGHAYYLTPLLRLYGEAGWAFRSDVSEPWEFQFGLDYAPIEPTGWRGAPFFALNAHWRQEVDFSGALTAQAGWAWRSSVGSPLLRAGVHYYNGKSNQFAFFNEHEQQIGMGLWYDF